MANQVATLTAKVSRRERAFYVTMAADVLFGLIASFHPHVSFADITTFITVINALATFYITGESYRQSNVDVRNPKDDAAPQVNPPAQQ